MINVSNKEFIDAVFSEDAPWCHVTDFPYDPSNIPKDKHLIAWKGDYLSRYNLTRGHNQYFTISTFYCDDEQQARRRKALYRQTHCLVLDDVREKLSEEAAAKLPRPSWILETSPGSFQWGYIFDKPVSSASKIDNLNDGLIASELAPSGKDPGQRGVTRYVRLPEGSNNKASKLVDGQPFPCRMTLWEPFNRVAIEQLAEPFNVDLDAVRRESRIDGAAAVSDHPLINIPEIIHIKEVRSDGRFDIKCPWVEEHTGADDSGSAVFTNADGTIGFKCHHGACQERTGRDLIQFIDGHSPGFSSNLKTWQIMRDFSTVTEPEVSFMAHPVPVTTPQPTADQEVNFFSTPTPPVPITTPSENDAIQLLFDSISRINPNSTEAREMASSILKHTDDLSKLDQIHWHTSICDVMGWGKGELKDILKDLRKEWYGDRVSKAEFYDDLVYIREQNQFYEWRTRIFYSAEAFQNAFSHEDAEARKIALQEGRVMKVDKLDYAPKNARIFIEGGITYANSWVSESHTYGEQGDASLWLDHFGVMGWGEYSKHIMQWMAWTLRHPDVKINHMLLFGGHEGSGKDYLLYPLTQAMRDNCTVISGDELLSDFNDQLLSTKYLHINETELGDHREATRVSNKIKPLAAAPPDKLRVNQKGVKPVKVRNIMSVSMTTNSEVPLKLDGASRRILALWSDLNTRDEHDEMTPEWNAYWQHRWDWMKGGGWQYVVWYLMNVVDLSDFNPGKAPPMTDFLRDIKEASKSKMQQTVEVFIKKKIGNFKSDLVTSTDMSDTLRSGGLFHVNEMYAKSEYFTPVKTGTVVKSLKSHIQLKCYNLGSPVKLWVLRDRSKYEQMDSKELYREYERQMKVIRGTAAMHVVK